MRRTSSYYHTTLQPYRSPEATSSTRQHHEREAAHLRCIGAHSPSLRVVRDVGVDVYTPTILHHHQPPWEKNDNSVSARCSSVSWCSDGSVQSSCNYACLLSPFAYLCTQPSPRSVSDARPSLPGLFLCMFVLGRFTASFSAKTDRRSSSTSVISTASGEDSSSTNLQKSVGGSWRCHRLLTVPRSTLLCILREAALSAHKQLPGIRYMIIDQKISQSQCTYPTAAAAAVARPPQPINRAAAGTERSCCDSRPFDCATHTAVVYPAV